MITFDFDYYRPFTIDEAVSAFKGLNAEGKKPVYHAGGTELICRARLNQLVYGAVIDLKGIPECNVLELKDGKIVIGSAVTLTKISDSGIFPMLGEACKAAADHTARDKITLGGNICGSTPYKEALPPFLVSDSLVITAGSDGIRQVPINVIFHESLQLSEGEFLVRIETDQSYAALPYISRKRTKQGKTDYPLVTISALKKDMGIRLALSGVCGYPFRSLELEKQLNDKYSPINMKIDNALRHLPGSVISDLQGSAEYREFVLTNILSDTLTALEGVM